MSRIDRVLREAASSMGSLLPDALADEIDLLSRSLLQVKEKAATAIPDGIKQAENWLREIQDYVYTGGDAMARAERKALRVTTEATVTLTEELRLMEGVGATVSARGGFSANATTAGATEEGIYDFLEGYPDLWDAPNRLGERTSELIPTFAGKIVSRQLLPGEKIYRVFGPALIEGVYGVKNRFGALATGYMKSASDMRAVWGLYEVPADAEAWRKLAAVLDEWNHDGFVILGEVLDGASLRACTGTIAEQVSEKLPQYLPGGGKQAVIEFPLELRTLLNEAGEKVAATGAPVTLTAGGVRWEIRSTGWSDATGVHGYREIPGPGAVRTERLGATERAPKAAE